MSHKISSPFRSKQSERVYLSLNRAGDPFDYDPSRDPQLDVIGLLLWATEGDKSQLSLANGSPAIIERYLAFLRNVCRLREDKIKAVIHCHDTLPYEDCLEYWVKITSIPTHRFNKPFIKKDKGGTRRYPYGILRIVATNIKLAHRFKERLAEIGLPQH